jgi:hypothetical protein
MSKFNKVLLSIIYSHAKSYIVVTHITLIFTDSFILFLVQKVLWNEPYFFHLLILSPQF